MGVSHFKNDLDEFGNHWSGETIWPAVRRYNSGHVDVSDLSDGQGATHSYVSDIANRVKGYTEGTIGT